MTKRQHVLHTILYLTLPLWLGGALFYAVGFLCHVMGIE